MKARGIGLLLPLDQFSMLIRQDADGSLPPVVHVDSDAELRADNGRLLSDEPWGIYVKRDHDSVQGGSAPLPQGPDFAVDPYPTGSVDPGFPDEWSAALSHCFGRFEGVRARYRQVRSGGVARSPPTTSRSSTGWRQRLRRRRLKPRLQDDRRSGARVARKNCSASTRRLLHPLRCPPLRPPGDLHPVSHSPPPLELVPQLHALDLLLVLGTVAAVRGRLLDRVDRFHPGRDLAEHGVLAVEPRRCLRE